MSRKVVVVALSVAVLVATCGAPKAPSYNGPAKGGFAPNDWRGWLAPRVAHASELAQVDWDHPLCPDGLHRAEQMANGGWDCSRWPQPRALWQIQTANGGVFPTPAPAPTPYPVVRYPRGTVLGGYNENAPGAVRPQSTHVVKPRETLSRIAIDHHTTVTMLCRVNKLIDPNLIYVGQVLVVP